MYHGDITSVNNQLSCLMWTQQSRQWSVINNRRCSALKILLSTPSTTAKKTCGVLATMKYSFSKLRPRYLTQEPVFRDCSPSTWYGHKAYMFDRLFIRYVLVFHDEWNLMYFLEFHVLRNATPNNVTVLNRILGGAPGTCWYLSDVGVEGSQTKRIGTFSTVNICTNRI